MRDSQNIDLSNLSTKTEMAELKADVKAEFAKVRTEMAETKVELIKWVIGIGFAQAGFVLAMLRFTR